MQVEMIGEDRVSYLPTQGDFCFLLYSTYPFRECKEISLCEEISMRIIINSSITCGTTAEEKEEISMRQQNAEGKKTTKENAGFLRCRPYVTENSVILVDASGKRIAETPEFPTEQEAWEYLRENRFIGDDEHREGDGGTWKDS